MVPEKPVSQLVPPASVRFPERQVIFPPEQFNGESISKVPFPPDLVRFAPD